MNDFVARYYDRRAVLKTGTLGDNLVFHRECSSTNDLARILAEGKAPEGTVVAAGYQTFGRGRMGRQWRCQPDQDITASLILYPSLPLADAFLEIESLALGITEAIEKVCSLIPTIKWPNDILIHDKKIAGILPESAISGDAIDWMILGFGVNVNSIFPVGHPLARTATSLKTLGADVRPAELLAEIVVATEFNRSHRTKAHVHHFFKQRMKMLGKEIHVEQNGKVLTGIATDLTRRGELVVRIDGNTVFVQFGDATIVK